MPSHLSGTSQSSRHEGAKNADNQEDQSKGADYSMEELARALKDIGRGQAGRLSKLSVAHQPARDACSLTDVFAQSLIHPYAKL